MAAMTEEAADQVRETCWSANKKTDAVLRLLRGERLDELSRELRIEAVAAFVELYNNQWLIERLGHRTPQETYQQWIAGREQAA